MPATPLPTAAEIHAGNVARTAALTPAEREDLAAAARAALASIEAILAEG